MDTDWVLNGSDWCLRSECYGHQVTLLHELLDTAGIEALLRANVPGLDKLRFRSGRQGVLSFIQATYANGLHMVQGNPALVSSEESRTESSEFGVHVPL